MSNNYYNLYIDNTFRLANTLSVKSTASADAVNSLITAAFGSSAVDPTKPETWKYYLNLCGEYHSSDVLMSITSLDTLEIITFTKENLSIHLATREAYQFGSSYYNELVNLYPTQVQLIKGILYPANMDDAVNKPDGSILSYQTDLVEEQEVTLISELEDWIMKFKFRWDVQAFGLSDTLYPAVHLGIMYLNLVPKILNLRLKRCKTNEAHSFHIRQYLASHNGLDRYLDFLTLKQALFLYRNIAYIEHHTGMQDTFDWMIDRLLTERMIPIGDYTMRHQGFDPDLYPSVMFKRTQKNLSTNIPEKDTFTLEEILFTKENISKENVDYATEHLTRISSQFKNETSSVVQTKILESSMLDYTDATRHTLEDILMNYWLWMSANGYYTAVTRFKDPTTDVVYTLEPSDAFIYMLYILARALGSDIATVPTYIALRVQRNPRPTVADVMSVADFSYVSDTDITSWLVSNQLPMTECQSREAFYTFCQNVYNNVQKQDRLVSNIGHEYKRAIVSAMVDRMYGDSVITFADNGMDFPSWLNLKGLPSTPFTVDQSLTLISEIVANATGSDMSTVLSTANVQKALISILKQLSSYSVQFLSEINSNPIKMLGWAAIRPGDQNADISNEEELEVIDVRLNEMDTSMSQSLSYDITYPTVIKSDVSINKTISLIFGVWDQESIPDIVQMTGLVRNFQFSLSVDYANKDPAVYQNTAFIGYESFLELTPEQQHSLKDIYPNSDDIFS